MSVGWGKEGENKREKHFITVVREPAAPGLIPVNTAVRLLLYTDELVLRSPTEQGLQQSLALSASTVRPGPWQCTLT